MIAYFFRFVDEEGPTGWVGFALAHDQQDMLWTIDQHGDPYQVEVQSTNCFSWCGLWNPEEDGDSYLEHEVADPYPAPDAGKWKKPSWVLNRLQEQQKKQPKREIFDYDKEAPF